MLTARDDVRLVSFSVRRAFVLKHFKGYVVRVLRISSEVVKPHLGVFKPSISVIIEPFRDIHDHPEL